MISWIYVIIMILISVVLLLLTLLAYIFVTPFDKPRKTIQAISRWISRLFFSAMPFWHTRRMGMEHIDKKQKYVIVLNHQSMIDIPMLYWTPLNFRWVTKKELLKAPIFGQYILLHGDITIDRGASRSAMEKMEIQGRKWLSRGVSIAVFPEGTRSKDGCMHRFKTGAFALAKDNGVGILPVVLDGTDNLMKKGWRVAAKHTFTIKVLPPVSAREVSETDVRLMAEKVHAMMEEARNQIRIKQ